MEPKAGCEERCLAFYCYRSVFVLAPRRLPFVRGTNTDKTEKKFADARRRPCRPSPTVPPRPVPWLPMAMADLTGAVGIASRRARARASQPPSPAGDVGKRKQLRRLYMRTPLAVGIATQLPMA